MQMRTLAYITLSVLLIAVSSCSNTKESEINDFAVMAYYVPEQDYQPEKVPVEKLTHIIYSFTKVIDGKMQFRNPEESGRKLELLVDQKSRNGALKVMIACGGWGADGFSDMVSTAENRKKFVDSAIEFIEKYELDGMDMDWEYPAIPAAGTKARKEDKQNFTLVMKELREALDQLNRPQTLTFASAGWKPYYDNIEMNKVMKYADFINIMTYDQATGSSPFTSHHTALGLIKEEDMKDTPLFNYVKNKRDEQEEQALSWEPQSVENIVNYCIDLGVDKSKIVIGAAFYGRAWKGVSPNNNGLYQKNEGPVGGGTPYSHIRDSIESSPNYTRFWDDVAKAPYLFNKKDSIWISYDDTVSLTLKTQYSIDNKLGGIMFWQLGHDTKENNSLLNTIYKTSRSR